MSYRLIDSNAIAIKYSEVNEMPCVFADLPDGMNGQFIDAQPELSQVARDIATIIENEQDMRVMLSQQWIPVSERLPEPNEIDDRGFIKAYLVQDARWMDVARWDGDNWIAWGHGTRLENVIAWMPLPKPYKEDEDGTGNI